MEQFTASNGIRIHVSPDTNAHHPLEVVGLGLLRSSVDALREFFRAEEDERLGRWRWPGDHDITVRVAPKHAQRGREGGTVMIQRDSDGYVGYRDRTSLPEITDTAGSFVRAGHAYFDAHPEPKPWHDAQPGELWALRFAGDDDEKEYLTQFKGTFFARISPDEDAWFDTAGLHAKEITTGRRIWPEEGA